MGLGIRLNPDVLDSELFASAGESFGEVAATIVSHDAFDGNTEAPEVGYGGDQERDGALRDAGFGDADLGCDVLLGAALTAQVFDGVGCGKRDLAWRGKRS